MKKTLTLNAKDRNRPTVAVDFDATLWDMMAAVARHVAPDVGLSEDVAYRRLVSDWGACHELLGGRVDEVFAEVFRSAHMRPYGLLPGAADALAALADDGYRIVVMTHRPLENIDHVAEHLLAHGATISEVQCGPAFDKIAASRAAGARILVDDKPATIVAAHAAGLPVATLRWPYNATVIDELAIPHGAGWDIDLLEIVRAAAATSATRLAASA